MAKEIIGECKFCGQMMAIDKIEEGEDANELATLKCKCLEGKAYRDKTNDLKSAFENIEVMFPKFPESTVEFLKEAAIAVRSGYVDKTVVKLDERTTATIKLRGGDHIVVERKKTEVDSLETI